MMQGQPEASSLIWHAGESENPQGVVNTSDGRVVRAFHRFTLVDQSNRGRCVAKGRRREQGAVKISCARQVLTPCHVASLPFPIM